MAALTPWNELRVALAELADAEAFLSFAQASGNKEATAILLAQEAMKRIMESVGRAVSAIAPEDANNT